ncbi:MAG: hypothetical protein OXT03_03835 [Alphaproteobacteria bacterium]|nr:hypothetical protein [Alphaproteobacteria bacterium]
MEKIEASLALFNTFLTAHGEKLREKLGQNISRQKQAKEAFSELEETCAHLRADISSLKKQCATQIQDSQKAGKQIDAAIQQLDAVLSVNESIANETVPNETVPNETVPNETGPENESVGENIGENRMKENESVGENRVRENEPHREGEYRREGEYNG